MLYLMESIGMFFVVIAIMAILLPFWGGCFSILLFLFLMFGFIILVSINFIWVLAIGLILYASGFIMKYRKYRQIPTFAEYCTKYPQCRLDDGVACYACGTTHLTNRGLYYSSSKSRYYVCQQCGATLFRFKVL